MHQLVRRYARSIHSAADPQAGLEVLSSAAIEFGFAGVSCSLWPLACGSAAEPPAPGVLLSGSHTGQLQAAWHADYLRTGRFKADPCYGPCRAFTGPIVWSLDGAPEIIRGHPASALQLRGMETMYRQTGLRGGIAVPLRAPGSWFGYFSYASTGSLDWLLARQEEVGDHLLSLTYRYYETMADRLTALAARQNGLSRQELECLTLLAIGRTVREIARVCGLPYSTVRLRLHSVEAKLKVRGRAQAIARAGSLGLFNRLG